MCTPSTLSTGNFDPTSLAVDTTGVYWINYGQVGTVQSVPLNGGPLTQYAAGQAYPGVVALFGTDLYWTCLGTDWLGNVAGSTVNTLPENNMEAGAALPLESGSGKPYGIAVDANYIYYTDYVTVPGFFVAPNDVGHVYRVPHAGGPPEMLEQISFVNAIAIDADSIYFSTYQSGADAIYQRPKTGGLGLAWPITVGQNLPSAPVTDGSYVYWVGIPPVNPSDAGAFDGDSGAEAGPPPAPVPTYNLLRVPKMAGPGPVTTPQVLGPNQPNAPYSLAVDGVRAYWASSQGFLYSVPVGGGTPLQLATTSGNVQYVALDDSYAYWSDSAAGTINKVPK
jgi:hypothetical protein